MTRYKVLVVDDERMIRWSVQQALEQDGFSVTSVETGEEALSAAAEDFPDAVLLDITLPGISGLEVLRQLKAQDSSVAVVMVTAIEDLKVAVQAMRLGAYDYISKPFDLDRLKVVLQNALDRHDLTRVVEFHRRESVRKHGFHTIVGNSARIRAVIEVAGKVANSDATTVLLQGESGTGKDLLAQAIHFESRRATRPFLPINCTALPDQLLESELMGHEKGAFTDAKVSRKGLFEVANEGTVFLDEIGDMKPDLQAKLLRFIENKMFRRVGGHRDISVDVRIIAATNKDLDELVRSGRFRDDLYYRLNVVPIRIPPLRERREDILPLAEHFLENFAKDFKRPVSGFTREAEGWMAAHAWPGNVRELRNLIERAIILGLIDGEGRLSLPFEPFPEERVSVSRVREGGKDPVEGSRPVGEAVPRASGPDPIPASFLLPPGGVVLEDVEKSLIRQALEVSGGNQTRAADMLGLSRDALRYRMKKFGFMQGDIHQ